MPPWLLKITAFIVKLIKNFFLIKGPIWYTEGGFTICASKEMDPHCYKLPNNILSEKEQEEHLRDLVQNAYEIGIERWFIYAWNNAIFTHMVDNEKNLTITAKVMKDIIQHSE